MGKVKIAEMLCRAGLHLGKTTVERILKEEPVSPPTPVTENDSSEKEQESAGRTISANYANHVWGLDLTTVPVFGGPWASWMPNAFPQCWPFCWWLALVEKVGWLLATTRSALVSPNAWVQAPTLRVVWRVYQQAVRCSDLSKNRSSPGTRMLGE